jgi:uncharacterized secreted protein with C-terminal beta-propeller domain
MSRFAQATAFVGVLVLAVGIGTVLRDAPTSTDEVTFGTSTPEATPPPRPGGTQVVWEATTPAPAPGTVAAPAAPAARLATFNDCGALTSWYREAALARVRPWGIDGLNTAMHGRAVMAEGAVADDAAAPAGGGGTAAMPAAPQEGVDYSGTNVQEAGVDEPDIVKTDGRLLLTVARNAVQVLDVSTGQPQRRSTIPLPEGWGHELLLDGRRLLVMLHGDGQPVARGDAVRSMPEQYNATSTLLLFDLTDPSAPREVARLDVDGDYLSARKVGSVARVVLRSSPPGPAVAQPEIHGPEDEARAKDAWAQGVRTSTIADWLPHFRVRTPQATRTDVLVSCDEVHHPASFSDFGMVTVLSVDLQGSLIPASGASVAAGAETVYASPANLYVALGRWDPPAGSAPGSEPASDEAVASSVMPMPEEHTRTEIHQFDITDPAQARYLAAGSAAGRLLNQWALSEHNGVLRVATTEGATWAPEPGREPPSASAVRVLARDGERLVEIGKVDGLGKGERIYSVRYMGDVGYVVTFRETDPLYTLDLSDPRNPRVMGELKILGYSAYLHPIGDGLLLGVGQDATEEGQRLGTQLSIFDVSDLTNPRRIHQRTLDASGSAAEYDHRAFLWWGPHRLAVIPVERWASGPSTPARPGVHRRDGVPGGPVERDHRSRTPDPPGRTGPRPRLGGTHRTLAGDR